MGLLLETDDGLTTDWAVVKRVCGRSDKQRDWVEKDSSGPGTVAARKLNEAPLVRREETRDWVETGSTSTSVVKGPFGGAALEKLTQMVRDLHIAQAHDRRPPTGHQCLWCDAVGDARKDCGDFAEAIRSNVVYLWNRQVHARETRRSLELNVG